MSTPPIPIDQFAAKVRSKYPGAYDHLSDAELVSKVVNKYPEYKNNIASYAKTDFEKGVTGEGISFKGAPGAALSYASKIPGSLLQSVDPTRGLSGAALTGIGINPRSGTVGERLGEVPLAGASKEAQFEYQRSRQAGSNPLAAGASAGIAGLGSLFGVSAERGYQQAEKGEGGKIIGEAAVPAAMAAAPLAGEAVKAAGIPGRMAEGLRTEGGYGPIKPGVHAASKVIGMGAGHYTGIPGLGELGGYLIGPEAAEFIIPRKAGMPSSPGVGETAESFSFKDRMAAHAEMEADIQKGLKERRAAYSEMNEDFANKAKQEAKDLQDKIEASEKTVSNYEKARQKEISDWAKVDKVSAEDAHAFQDRINELEQERQKELANTEKLRNQHAESLQQRGAQQAAMDASHAQELANAEKERQGVLASQERLKEQHAAALNARKAPKTKAPPPAPAPSPFAGMTSTAAPIGSAELPPVPQGQPAPMPPVRGGQMPPPPAPATFRTGTGIGAEGLAERPTVGSQVAAKAKADTSLLSRGRTLVEPGMEPDMNNPVHAKIINDLQTRSGAQLRTMAANGDRFAAFVLRHMPRP